MNNQFREKINKKINSSTILFFDMDWTLVDTNQANFLSYKKAIQLTIWREINIIYDSNYRFNRNILKIIIPDITDLQYNNIIIEKEKYYIEFLHTTRVNNLAMQILEKYHKKNKIILVTNCRRKRVFETLRYHRLANKFDYIFYWEMNDKWNKFNVVISKNNFSPNLIVVFENEKLEKNNAIKSGILKDNIILLPNLKEWKLL
jgi:beta-phosphoglucomutase